MRANRRFQLNWALSLLVSLIAMSTLLGIPSQAHAQSHPPGQQVAVLAKKAVSKSWWKPRSSLRWQVQLSKGLELSVSAQVYVVDGVDTPTKRLRQAQKAGKKLVCYINAGAWENWRADRKQFPKRVIGKKMSGWPGERWLDIRKRKDLLPLMAARMDACKRRGFVAVDPDNMDGYSNDTGFRISKSDQRKYFRALARLAHQRGLAIGLKNAPELVSSLAGVADFAINESCVKYQECHRYAPMLHRKKPVISIEYQVSRKQACRKVPSGIQLLFKQRSLDASVRRCP